MTAPSVRFEIDDTVILSGSLYGDSEDTPDLLGRVDRTYHALDSHEPLEDCLIIAYLPVPTAIVQEFAETGRPPKGYVYVDFALEECGYGLLPEEAISLLSRAFAIGDTVKQDANSAMYGTVIDVQSTYLVYPICRQTPISADDQDGTIKFTDLLYTLWTNVGEIFNRPNGPDLTNPSVLPLYKLKKDDLRRAGDFESGDQVVSHDWIGIIESDDCDAAVLLDNQTVVWVSRPWELEIIVSNLQDKPLVTLPESNDIRRPDVLNAHQNGILSMAPTRVRHGDIVITNKRNLKDGRWLEGKYDPDCQPRGRVLDVRTRAMDMHWLVPNVLSSSGRASRPPSSRIRPYDNLTSFRNPRDLRRVKDLARYDHDRKPSKETDLVSDKPSISTGEVYYPGDQVVLRNPKGQPNVAQIAATKTFGFDMNLYTVYAGFHQVSVLWQDGSITNVDSKKLTPYTLPETDLCPGDLVIARKGLLMLAVDRNPERPQVTSDFNEMSFFERDHTLVPTKVGVIQSVDAQERLARVRWYAKPEIKLRAYGQVLQQAHFGQIGEEVEDVSLYEILTEPALVRKRGDLVVVPPVDSPKVLMSRRSLPGRSQDILRANPPGPTTLSYLQEATEHVVSALWEIARAFADSNADASLHSPPAYDWIGEIIDIRLDGYLTVRLGGLKDCKDVNITHDQILLVVDENAEFYPGPDDSMETDELDEAAEYLAAEYPQSRSEGSSIVLHSDEESAIDEIVEYEGGRRLDDDSGEDEWSTDDDTPESISQEEDVIDGAGEMDIDELADGNVSTGDPRVQFGMSFDEDSQMPDVQGRGTDRNHHPPNTSEDLSTQSAPAGDRPRPHTSGHDASASALAPYLLQTDAPGSFEILEQLPPPDQYNHAEVPSQQPAFLKRISKEHRILASSLPHGEIWVRTYESRLDLLRCLIVGPANTPYEYCPFVVDLYLGPTFPSEPPKAHFHSWTSGLGRINPNLYEDGKICLSLLGTWPGQSEHEGWSEGATILQVLVSLQGLVFVSQPFYNEAGYETYGEEKVYSLESQQYSEKAYVMARGFVRYALEKAPSGLEDVVTWLYLCRNRPGAENGNAPGLLSKVIERARLLMERSAGMKELAILEAASKAEPHVTQSSIVVDGVGNSTDATKTFLKPLSKGALVMLRKIVVALGDIQQIYDSAATEIM